MGVVDPGQGLAVSRQVVEEAVGLGRSDLLFDP